jgi:hypothetical protein
MLSQCCHTDKIISIHSDILLCHNPACNNYLAPTSSFYSFKSRYQIFICFFFIFYFILIPDDYSSIRNEKNIRKSLIINSFNEIPLTKENLRHELSRQEILCSDHVFAQILIESGHLGSFLTRKTNNLTGMRYPFKRTSTAIGLYIPEKDEIVMGTQKELLHYQNLNVYAVYDNWLSSVADYKIWQTTYFDLNDTYLSFLGSCYAADEHYAIKIRKMVSAQK